MSEVKWKVELNLDFGDLIPKEEELKPHDYPLNVWAAEAFGGMLVDLIVQYQMDICDYLVKKAEATTEEDKALYEALIEGRKKDVEIAKMMKQFKIEQVKKA